MPSIEKELNFTEFPELFRDRYATVSMRTEMAILSRCPPPPVAEELGTGGEFPLLQVKKRVLAADGSPVGCSVMYLTADCGPIIAKSGRYLSGAR